MGCGGEKSISCIFKVVHILALTYYVNRGWIANEVFRRVHPEGSTIGSFVREKISKEFEARVFVGVHDAEISDYAPVAEVISEISLFCCQFNNFNQSLTGRKVKYMFLSFLKVKASFLFGQSLRPKSLGRGVDFSFFELCVLFNRWLILCWWLIFLTLLSFVFSCAVSARCSRPSLSRSTMST